jgi:hypothetical protein
MLYIFDGLLDWYHHMSGVKPMYLNGFAERLHLCLVDCSLPRRTAGIMAPLDHKHRRSDLLRIRDSGTGGVLRCFLLGRAPEQGHRKRLERFGSVLVLERPIGCGDARHASGPQVGAFAQGQES